MMWRKETRWQSFSREHSGVKLFSQRASCSQLELEVGQHLAALEIYGCWVIPGPQHWRPSRRQPDDGQSWRGCRAGPCMGVTDSRLSFGGSPLALASTVVIHGQTGRCPERGWVCSSSVTTPSTPLGPENQTHSTALQSVLVPCLLWEPRRSFGPVFRGTDLAFTC